jgi:hypothetical protein
MQPQKVLHLHLEEAKKKPKLQGLYMLSEKLDGWYVTIDYDPSYGWFTPVSSAGRVIPSMLWAKEIFERLPEPKEYCRFIMEATIPGLDFHTANGIFNRSIGDFECKDVVFSIHDYIQYSVINSIDAINRYKLLTKLDTSYTKGRVFIHPLLHVGEYNRDNWMLYFDEVASRDGEGIVAKRETGLYSPGKRNSDLLKIKLEDTFDLLCIRMYWTVGEKGHDNLNLDLQNKAGVIVPVRIGKHSDIAKFQVDSPVGKVIQIKAMCQLPDGSYREPRYDCERFDKLPSEID